MVRKFPKDPLNFAEGEKETGETPDSNETPTDTSEPAFQGTLTKVKSRRKHRFHPGTVSLRNIAKYQKSTGRLSARQTFKRNLLDVLANMDPSTGRTLSADAVDILHEITENLFVGIVRQANRIAVDNRRVTVMPRDFRFVVDTMFKMPTLEQQCTL